MGDREPLSHIIVKGLFALVQNKFFLIACVITLLVLYAGWTSKEVTNLLGQIVNAIKALTPEVDL